MSARHYLVPPQRWPLRILLIGCGGNGAHVLTGLAALDLALRSVSGRSLAVTTVDPDIVSEANLGRQPFFSGDVGRPKAVVLTERLNFAYGLGWRAERTRCTEKSHFDAEIVISCVDTAAARRAIAKALTVGSYGAHIYWLDLGNRASDGQIVLGETGRGFKFKQLRLPTVMDRFPELADPDRPEDDSPSCSLAEALTKQSLFVNRTLATHALAMLDQLLSKGSVDYAGLFLNLASGLVAPMPLPQPTPEKPQAKRAHPSRPARKARPAVASDAHP